MIGSIMRCRQCGANTPARVSPFHSMHPAGLWVGRLAFVCAAAGAVWVGWWMWQPGPEGTVADDVLMVAYAAFVALFTGVAMTWRHRAAMRLRQW
jgi:hypothetical protein